MAGKSVGAASVRLGPASTLETCLGTTTGTKADPSLLQANILDLGIYVGAAEACELPENILALVEGSTLKRILAMCLFWSSVEFGFNLTLGERRGADSALVSRRLFIPGAFDNLFLTAEEAGTEVSFEADIGRLSNVLDGVSLASVKNTKYRQCWGENLN
jgi:hypothetical protein